MIPMTQLYAAQEHYYDLRREADRRRKVPQKNRQHQYKPLTLWSKLRRDLNWVQSHLSYRRHDMEKIKQYPVLATIGMLLVLSAAVGLDRWLGATQAKAGRSFNLTPVVTTAVLANLMLVFLWLGLLWLALIQPQPNGLVATLYLTVGGLLTLSPIMAAKG